MDFFCYLEEYLFALVIFVFSDGVKLSIRQKLYKSFTHIVFKDIFDK